MIIEATTFLNSLNVPINFVNHLVIFLGVFYVAIHNRSIPQWHITPLWYLGLFHIFVSITIFVQWTIGPEHPLSYWNIGLVATTLANIALAFIVVAMFATTLNTDIKGRKLRKKNGEISGKGK